MNYNVHPQDSYELSKFKMMKNALERLLEDDNLEICSRTTFERTDEKGIEYSVEGYCVMPLYQTPEFDGHFEFRIIREVHDSDCFKFDIRFYNNSVVDEEQVEIFKAVFDADKYDDYDTEDEAYRLYNNLRTRYMDVQDELERLSNLMKGILEVNNEEKGKMVGGLEHEMFRQQCQNGGPKPPYTPPPARPYPPYHPPYSL